METTESNQCKGADVPQERMTRQRRVRNGWLAIAWVVVGFSLGLLVGSQAGRLGDMAGIWRQDPPHDAPASRDARLTPRWVEQYRQELIRLTQARNEDTLILKEKQLTLQILNARGVSGDTPSARRLPREVGDLEAALRLTDDRLTQVREQLAELTSVTSAAESQERGLDEQTEIDAKRIVLQHDAGLPLE